MRWMFKNHKIKEKTNTKGCMEKMENIQLELKLMVD